MGGDRRRVLVVGCGAMGARHAAVVAADPECELLVTDRDPERARAVAERFGARATEPGAEVDLAVVATPTTTHLEVAGSLLARGVWVLCEKPLADRPDAARQLAHPRCSVGHSERYNPAVRAAGALTPTRVEATRTGPPTARGLDVDVVLDLMSHDLDLVLGWIGPADRIEATGDRDAVQVRLWAGGSTAELVASRIASERRRWIRCEEPDRVVELDLLAGRASRDGVALASPDPRDALTCQWAAFRDRAHRELADPDPGVRAIELADRIRCALG